MSTDKDRNELIPIAEGMNTQLLIPFNRQQLKALGEDTRLSILSLLAEKPHSIAELSEALKNMGVIKSTTTIRHHVDVLKNAGFVHLVGVKEGRGAMLKYYGSSSKFRNHSLPVAELNQLQSVRDQLLPKLQTVIFQLVRDHGQEIIAQSTTLAPCEKCDLSHFVEYIITQLTLSGLAEVFNKHEFKQLLRSQS